MSRPVDSGFPGLPHVGTQARQDIDYKVDGAAMPRMLNLRLILQLVVDGLNDETLPQQEFVAHQHQAVFHVGFDAGDELETLFPQGLKERLREITLIANQFAKQGCHPFGDGFAVIDIAWGERESQDF
jgi:hypothetical protein